MINVEIKALKHDKDNNITKNNVIEKKNWGLTINCFQSKYHYNNDISTSAPSYIPTKGHIVVIVGWDDNSKDNFNSQMCLKMMVHSCAKTA